MRYYIKNLVSIDRIAAFLNYNGFSWHFDTERLREPDFEVFGLERNQMEILYPFVDIDIDSDDYGWDIASDIVKVLEQMEE